MNCHSHYFVGDCTQSPRAVIFSSTLNGSSQPAVVMASGLKEYVVKFRDFTGQFGLMGEVIGNELMAHMGLPVPKWSPIYVSQEFIDKHPNIWYRSRPDSKGIRPKAGLHFGSRLTLSEGCARTWTLIPHQWIGHIANLEDLAGALLVDLWANNCDRRQYVVVTDGTGVKRLVFIDNDAMFGGWAGTQKTCPGCIIRHQANLFSAAWTEPVIRHWRSVIDGISDSCLDRIVSLVPEEWRDPSALSWARGQLDIRRRQLDLLIEEVTIFFKTCRVDPCEQPRDAMEENWRTTLSRSV